MNLLKKGESGQALATVLVLLALGSLIVVPTLNLAGTSLGSKRSPHAAAIIPGMLHAERPNRMAEMVKPAGVGHKGNRLNATAWMR